MPFVPTSSRGGSGSGSAISAYPSLVTALSPYLYWECQDSSGNLTDNSGNSRPGVAAGTAATYRVTGPGNIAGATPAAVQFADATTAFAGGTPNPQSNFAVELWYYTTTFTVAQLLTSANTGGNNFTIQTLGTINQVNVIVQGVATLATFATSLILNQWNQIVIAKASGAAGIWRYWLNGQLDTPNAGTAAPGAAQTGSFQVNGAAAWRIAHTSVILNYFPTNGDVLQRYQSMLFGP